MIRNEYMTTTEAAEMMLCSRTYVVSLIKAGRLPAYKVGNRNYISAAAVKRLVAANTFPAAACAANDVPAADTHQHYGTANRA